MYKAVSITENKLKRLEEIAKTKQTVNTDTAKQHFTISAFTSIRYY